MTAVDPTDTDLEELRRALPGRVAVRGEDGAQVRPWNPAITVDPAIVVRVGSTDDVAAAVRFAGRHGHPVSALATGHGYGSDTPPGLLILTSGLDRLSVDPEARVATVGAGVLARDLLTAAAEHGLAAPLGSAGTVSVVGYLSGGGIGPVVRTFGLSADSVIAATVVTGDGQVRSVSADDEADLFRAIRGGGDHAGIVTEVQVALHDVTSFYGGAIVFDAADAADVVPAWTRFADELPEEVTTSLGFLAVPDLPAVPPPLRGRRIIAVRLVSLLDDPASEELFAPIRALAPAILDDVLRRPYAELPQVHNDPVEGSPGLIDGIALTGLPPAGVDAFLATLDATAGTSVFMLELRRLGGAYARPIAPPAVVDHRERPYLFSAGAMADPADPGPAKAALAAVHARFADWSDGHGPANFLAHTGDRASMAYSSETIEFLRQLAGRVDPGGLLPAL